MVRHPLHRDQAISACYTAKVGLGRVMIVEETILGGDLEALRSGQAKILVFPERLEE